MDSNSFYRAVRAFRVSLGRRVFQSLPVVVVLATLIAFYLLTCFSFGSDASGASNGKDRAVSAALKHISVEYPGTTRIELSRASRDEGVWLLTFRCVREPKKSDGSTGQRTTIRLFFDERSLNVWGFSADGW